MAIATGLSDGLEYGLNARAALVTRGLAEITRLAMAMGAQQKTMMGLAGMGDLILHLHRRTLTQSQSGLRLSIRQTLASSLNRNWTRCRRPPTIDEVFKAACHYQIDMPITQVLYQLVRNELSAQDVVERLMLRETKSE